MPESKANDRQVGGSHYKGVSYEHWDFSWDLGLDGITHTGTKYLSRWRKKGGLEDLDKVDHYFQKLQDLGGPPMRFRALPQMTQIQIFWRFVQAIQMPLEETIILYWMCFWKNESELQYSRDLMQKFITKERIIERCNEKLINLRDDSNKHEVDVESH